MKKPNARPANRLGLSLFAAGAVFFFNPFINVLDLVPDFVGALLFIIGLSKLRDVTPYFDRSRTAFRRLFWVSLSRIPAFFLMYKIFVEHATEQSIMTVFTYCYAICETVLMYAAFSCFFDGMVYVGERYENTTVFRTVRTEKGENGFVASSLPAKEGKKPPRRMEISALKVFTLVALVFLRVFSVLPELVYLSGQSGDAATSIYRISQTVFKPFYFTLAFLPALALGIVWLVAFRRYMHGVMSDDAFCAAVLDYYDASFPAEHRIHCFRRFSRATVLLGAVAVFSADLFLDGQNVLPDIVSSFLLLAAMLYISRRVVSFPVSVRVLGFAAVAVSGVSYLLGERFFGSFAFSDVWRKDEATARYLTWLVSDGVSTVMFFVLFSLVVCTLLRFVRTELGVSAHETLNARERGEIAEFRRREVAFSVIAAISAVSSVLFRFFLADTESVQIAEQGYVDATHLYVPRVDFYWLVDLLVGIVVLCATLCFFEKAKDSLKYKYSLDE